jgi:acyl carrier protein
MRIELGEIETILASHDEIREAVVTLHGGGGQPMLAAYLVPRDGKCPMAGELERLLRSKLPEHMVPASYWRLSELPVLPSGKIDRKALSPGVGVPLREGQELVPPRNEAESKLAEIWRELLAVDEVGIDQNFFELGGHSLLVLQMIARIGRIFQVKLPVRSVFEEPTIEGLAVELEKAQALGLKAPTPIVPRHAASATAGASREAILSQLDSLSAAELQSLLNTIDGKQPA